MKIKKLELVGFKSFVDRTVLQFDHDVIGIVGPNGCGKSNIVDAIRWCMGEQSAKHLRGRWMEDVIFNGSESRKPHSVAEVTLIFENTTQSSELPIEYREYPEIAVTRRLYRTGESEYFINKTIVRLRDITDLFLGTGVGTKAYAIVEQGKIGFIISAKPEDRRILIEEAAGITKFKSRKKEAERKIELTEQNLLRVGDILFEITRSLDTLQRQAKKAERYRAYRDELEDLQLYEASHRYLELAGWIKYIRSEVERYTERAEHSSSEVQKLELELEAHKTKVHAGEKTLESAQKEFFLCETKIREEEATLTHAQERLKELTDQQQQTVQEREVLQETACKIAEEKEGLIHEHKQLLQKEEELAQQLIQEERSLQEVFQDQEQVRKQLERVQQSMARVQAIKAGAESKLNALELYQKENAHRLERLHLEKANLVKLQEEEAKYFASSTESFAQLQKKKRESQKAQQEIQVRMTDCKQALASAEKEFEQIKTKLTHQQARLHTLLEVQARLEGIDAGVKVLMTSKNPTIVGLVADRLEAPANLTQALAALLGSRLQEILVRDRQAGLQLLHELIRIPRGRATLLPIIPFSSPKEPLPDDLLPYRLLDRTHFAVEDTSWVEALLGNTLLAETTSQAEEFQQRAPHATVVTVEGFVFYPDGRIAGGHDTAERLLESKRKIRELKEEVQALEQLVRRRREEQQTARQNLTQIDKEFEQIKKEAHLDELNVVGTEKDLHRIQSQITRNTAHLARLEEEELSLVARLKEIHQELEEVQMSSEKAVDELTIFMDQIQRQEANIEVYRERMSRRRRSVTAKKVDLASLKEKLHACKQTQFRLELSVQETDERKKKLDAQHNQLLTLSQEAQAYCSQHQEQRAQAVVHAQEASHTLSQARAVIEALRLEQKTIEEHFKKAQAKAYEISHTLMQYKMELRAKEIEMIYLIDGVTEKFRGLSLKEVIVQYHLRQPPTEAIHQRIQSLIQQIERMGSINLEATKEYTEAQERYQFYKTQKDDLEQALADLHTAIQQMDTQSKRLFEETFRAINEQFKNLFPTIFQGGSASLRLTAPEDPLETGIDILAQPPGKKLSTIELMSGGEKALTAISLLLAIFQIKPSPFCILDEVDAPLDEENVARYLEVVRAMTNHSQFILVTHSKRTMQMVDVLYGVTMAEPGVSKMVGVKIHEDTKSSG
ncbi:chromosome segregation protein SMC [Pajaroellobacter abortibovis]|uniref:Chromosome partition protein Smc n=1 Tax=Pajaroellobacter abortibovis TaxID=1882918 RepID=A0A1L6MXD3_9BACT|nr:chromosome segregation protein SMC [Pajaroellobacter abortibovis]APS00119.1 chromosome segregation protein SMC [Pajaroellobacter abortibovis]